MIFLIDVSVLDRPHWSGPYKTCMGDVYGIEWKSKMNEIETYLDFQSLIHEKIYIVWPKYMYR